MSANWLCSLYHRKPPEIYSPGPSIIFPPKAPNVNNNIHLTPAPVLPIRASPLRTPTIQLPYFLS